MICPIAHVIDYTEAVAAHIDAVTVHTAPLIIPIVTVKDQTEAVAAHTPAVTSHMHPFEPTATANKKWRIHFVWELMVRS